MGIYEGAMLIVEISKTSMTMEITCTLMLIKYENGQSFSISTKKQITSTQTLYIQQQRFLPDKKNWPKNTKNTSLIT